MTKKDIFHFNHIDSNIDEEKLKQIKDLYTKILTKETKKLIMLWIYQVFCSPA